MPYNFSRVAIINRGEPAMRLIHAVRELNDELGLSLRTIALYTEPDQGSLFVREADEAYCLGTATFDDPRDGERKIRYLDYAALERALKQTKADAAWVGWGFVAEHAEFADLCDRLRVVFVGPSGEVMRSVGDKIASKQLAERANVPVAPWSGTAVPTIEEAQAHAAKLGFPLMIKATAGGGGRGVRRVNSAQELAPAFESARAEALKFFGSATVFLERAIVGARHVEVQILADTHGRCWAVGVRDCTIQRRNQKVIEEAPSPALDAELESQLRIAAVRLAEAANYTNAGTVEFLFDAKTRAFYFMEINTRLQVEHPVTEATTGLDLVKQQLHIANGGHLEGDPPRTVGHAIEVRLNAEDADRNFAPAPGRIALLQLPTGPGLRVDSGVAQGDMIAPEFDSMIAKMIAYGKDRNEALARLRRALLGSAIVIRGGTSNKGFLLDLLSHPDILNNETDIGWLDRRGTKGFGPRPFAGVALIQAAIEDSDRERGVERKNFFVAASRGRVSVKTEVGHCIELLYAGETYALEVRRVGASRYRVLVDGARLEVAVERQSAYEQWLQLGGKRYRVASIFDGAEYVVEINGGAYRISRDDGSAIAAPSPAVVLAVHVRPGDMVEAGATLLVLEAMKMEMSVTAPCAGRVREVLVSPKVQVPAGAPLVLLESESGPSKSAGTKRVEFEPLGDCVNATGQEDDYASLLRELRRLMLGFEIDESESRALLESIASARRRLPADDLAAYAAEDSILSVFADLVAVERSEPNSPFEPRISIEESLLTYLRSVHLAGKGLSPRFVATLKGALAHYGVDTLEPTEALDEALVLLFKAMRRAAECAPHIFALLEFRIKNSDTYLGHADRSFRLLLDRVILVSQGRFLPVNDLAREARFQFFDRPLFESAQADVLSEIESTLSRVGLAPRTEASEKSIVSLVECPQPILGLLAAKLAAGDEAQRIGCLEIIIRRYYRPQPLNNLTTGLYGGCPTVLAEFRTREGMKHLVAVHAPTTDLKAAVSAAIDLVSEDTTKAPVVVDIFVVYENGDLDLAEARGRVAQALDAASFSPRVETLCFSFVGTGLGRKGRAFTFVVDDAGGYHEHPLHPGTHPTVAERMELWRLEHFKTEQLPSPEHIHLFHAVARDNPRDERLLSFVDVPDLTPRRDRTGQLKELPHLEHLYLGAAAGIREFQAQRPIRDRLLWNRIMLFLRPGTDLVPTDIARIARRLAPAVRTLGLEKTVVHLEVRNKFTGRYEPQVVHISNRAGTGLHLEFRSVPDYPLQPLSEYARRVVQMRRLGLVYAYEIIRMLAPSAATEQGEFPAGHFIEYDLNDQQQLEPANRQPGNNVANVVVGLISNRTAKHPEGMERVIVLSDASQGMGSLAEPECRRIIGALELAKQRQIPMEWFPVSSGAKIAMDVGTEALDWIAMVLRRLVEFTQDGGEVNVVLSGVNVGGQSYWNAEATMLMHTKGVLIMTPEASMVLTGKRALDYSGGVSADTNQGIGGVDQVMGPNGQSQYFANDLAGACQILLTYYAHSYIAPGEHFPRRARSQDPRSRDVSSEPLESAGNNGFRLVGDVFSEASNPGRKKPFDIRSVMRSVTDRDLAPLERWKAMRDAETAVVWDAHLGGMPVCMVGIESRPIQRIGPVPGDGPLAWTGGTLFPRSSKKVARALNAASGRRPVVVLANLSGFDGSPESMRELQLEYGAEIGRAVVNFRGPMVLCVVSRYHGGAYVVFSRALNEHLQLAALEGSHASVIGGAPAAAVVFPREVRALTLKDPRITKLQAQLVRLSDVQRARAAVSFDELYKVVYAEKQGELAEHFDRLHSVERAKRVGSLDEIVPPSKLRPYLIDAVDRGMTRWLESPNSGTIRQS